MCCSPMKMVSIAPCVTQLNVHTRMSTVGYSALRSSCDWNCKYVAFGMISHTTSPSRRCSESSRCSSSGLPAILIIGLGAV
eukprot:jgi/Chrpa1/23159/Chrysochromulina_OHIO_Genome00006963-RA